MKDDLWKMYVHEHQKEAEELINRREVSEDMGGNFQKKIEIDREEFPVSSINIIKCYNL